MDVMTARNARKEYEMLLEEGRKEELENQISFSKTV